MSDKGANPTGELFDDDSLMVPDGALAVFRRGVAASPILRRGIMSTIGLGASVAAARLVAPVLLQFALDNGVLGEKGIRPGVVLRASIAGAIVIVVASALFLG